MKDLYLPMAAIIAVSILIVIAQGMTKGKKSKDGYHYFKRKPLSENEQVMYWRLVKVLPDHVIMPQVVMSQCVGTRSRPAFATIAQKSIDFVVCTKASEIVAAIEIDDRTHNAAGRKKADETKNAALEKAGIQCIRWQAGKLPNETEIIEAINTASQEPPQSGKLRVVAA